MLQVPKGRPRQRGAEQVLSAVPPGLDALLVTQPGNELPGYSRMSLRDKNCDCITSSVYRSELHTQGGKYCTGLMRVYAKFLCLKGMNSIAWGSAPGSDPMIPCAL